MFEKSAYYFAVWKIARFETSYRILNLEQLDIALVEIYSACLKENGDSKLQMKFFMAQI